jgi:hypothetical protein
VAYAWVIGHSTIDSSGNITGYSQLCATVQPPVYLTMVGAMSEGVPAGAANFSVTPNSAWANAPHFTTTGKWPMDSANGGTVTTNPDVNLLGLKTTSSYAMASTPFPSQKGYMIAPADTVDVDGDGKPGFTNKYVHSMTPPGYFAGLADPTNGSFVDELYIVSRTESSLSGTISDCVVVTGTVQTLLNESSIIGCHVRADVDGGNRDCTTGNAMSEQALLDTWTPILMVGAGTFKQRQLTSDATCADVIAALP